MIHVSCGKKTMIICEVEAICFIFYMTCWFIIGPYLIIITFNIFFKIATNCRVEYEIRIILPFIILAAENKVLHTGFSIHVQNKAPPII